MHNFKIPLPKLFSWEKMRAYFTHSDKEILHFLEEEWLYKWLKDDGDGIIFRVRVSHDISEAEVQALNPKVLTGVQEEALRSFVEEWWDLRRDLQAFYHVASKDHLLAPLIEANPGLRIGGIPDLWECAVWSIVGQQVNISFAFTLKNRLINAYGNKKKWEGMTFWQFPDPESLVNSSIDELKELAISQRKAEYIKGFAELILSGEISKRELQGFSTAIEASERLKKIRGIGKWSSNYILLRCLRYPDAFPLGDAALYNAVRDLTEMERKPTDDELLELAKPWKGWEAYATYYLWYGK
ncbi:MAG: DNA-3-methyladenine glycosylase [Bacteroidota bacterium]